MIDMDLVENPEHRAWCSGFFFGAGMTMLLLWIGFTMIGCAHRQTANEIYNGLRAIPCDRDNCGAKP